MGSGEKKKQMMDSIEKSEFFMEHKAVEMEKVNGYSLGDAALLGSGLEFFSLHRFFF